MTLFAFIILVFGRKKSSPYALSYQLRTGVQMSASRSGSVYASRQVIDDVEQWWNDDRQGKPKVLRAKPASVST
jgi:hypothetical protein